MRLGIDTQAYKRMRLVILERDHWQCQVRGPRCTHHATQVDHIIPRIDGGAVLDPANMRASCARCNDGRNARRNNEVRRAGRYLDAVPAYLTRL